MLCRGPAFTSQQLEVTLHSSFSSLQSLASCRLQEPAQSTATFCMTLDIIPVPWGNFSCRRKGQLVQKQNFRLGKCAAVRAAPRSAEERAHWLGEVSGRVGWREGAAGKPAVCVTCSGARAGWGRLECQGRRGTQEPRDLEWDAQQRQPSPGVPA